MSSGHRIYRPGGYTLVELATTIAILVIILGLMVIVARQVRSQSAELLTQGLLVKLERVMSQYRQENRGQLPPILAIVADARAGTEADVQRAARINNEQFVRYLHAQPLWAKMFVDLPITISDQVSLRDAWGQPIVFMAKGHGAVGMAPNDGPFFFSAGPDRKYLTRADNLFSYESSETSIP